MDRYDFEFFFLDEEFVIKVEGFVRVFLCFEVSVIFFFLLVVVVKDIFLDVVFKS